MTASQGPCVAIITEAMVGSPWADSSNSRSNSSSRWGRVLEACRANRGAAIIIRAAKVGAMGRAKVKVSTMGVGWGVVG